MTTDDTTKQLEENGLVLKVLDWLQDYLSCKTRFLEDKKGVARTAINV